MISQNNVMTSILILKKFIEIKVKKRYNEIMALENKAKELDKLLRKK